MNHKSSAILLLLLAAILPAANAQHSEPKGSEAELLVDRFVTNYDSLLNSYVFSKYTATRSRHKSSASHAQPFDQISDTVIARRLHSLHTVIPMTYNNVVRSYIRMYLNRMSSRMDVMLTLSEYYHPLFEESLARYGVPEELKYLPIVESAMNPQATSRVGAAGLWQFMYTTGKNYGMEVNSVIDERRDPYKSSDAAAHYIHDLHTIFGDWTLAIAAYNCGPGNINKAIARSGGKRSFWEIYNYLPRETRGYIPAFIAATYVMNFYPEHGLHPARVNIPLRTDTIMVERDMLFCYVSQYTGVSMEELRTLNPQYRADFIPGEGGSYPLCLPMNKMNDLISWADTIFCHSEDSVGRRSVAPESESVSRPSAKSRDKKSYRDDASHSAYHKVRRGETLSSISRRYGTSVQRIKKLNGLKSDRIREGQRLRVR